MPNNNITVVFEDKEIIVFLKPPGVFTEGGSPNITELLHQYWGKEHYVGLVHRLDVNTAGLMVAAKTPLAAKNLSKQITDGAFEKVYLAAVEGEVADEDTWQDYLFKDGRQNKVFVVKNKRKGAKEAILNYRIVARACNEKGAYSLAEVHLQTGRTHQIRVQFASRGFPLAGDGKYGSKDNHAKCALFACKLTFKHPKSGEMLTFAQKPDMDTYPWNLFKEMRNDDAE